MQAELLEPFTPAVCRKIRQKLDRWFDVHGRTLPWRETRDPYFIWISEIMLQQTTVKAVVPFFERFIGRFPDVHALAAASEADVLKYWEGLGYYSRGRNLLKSAKQIVDQYGGQFPTDLEEIQSLPGIGRYTAGAIRSFAFNLPAPIVEANTVRLYARLLGFEGDPRVRAGQNLLWAFAERLQPTKNAGNLNQALMELGSLVCTPQEPNCQECPIKGECQAFLNGTQSRIPLPKEKPTVTETVEVTVAIQNEGRFLIRQRQSGERWAGMWDFIRFEVALDSGHSHSAAVAEQLVADQVNVKLAELIQEPVEILTLVHEIKHSVTRYRIRLLCYQAQFKSKKSSFEKSAGEFQWATFRQLKDLPMPITGRKFSKFLAESLFT